MVFATGDSADWARLQQVKRQFKELQKSFGEVDFHFDDKQVSIYKLSIPGEQNEAKVEDLYIKEPNGKLTLLSHDSAIISKIPKEVRTVRIFADCDGDTLRDIHYKVREWGRN